MQSVKSNRLSFYIYLLCTVIMCYASFLYYPRWKQQGSESAIAWDVSGYYWYLPSVFIYHDLKHQSFKDSILNKYQCTGTDFQQGVLQANGNYVMKYSSGMAVMYLPFFTASHLLAGALGYPRDGFSAPYQFGIQAGGLLISLLGLWYFRKLLLLFYSDKVVAIVLLLLVAGSNYLNFAAIDTGMSHCWLFTVYVFLLLNTYYFYQGFKMKYAVRIGLLIGLATLTRPTDVISCLIPLLWGMESISFTAIKNQLRLLIKHARPMLVAVVCAAAVISIQLIYWKYVSGHWVVYSYGDQGFSWLHPHLFLYSFNYRSGWLTYTPMLLLALPGFVAFLMKGRNKVAVVVFCVLNFYIVSAWNIWWYSGRAMVQSYPLFMFALAALVDLALQKKILLWLLIPVFVVFAYLNIWVTAESHGGNLYDCNSMTKNYYWRVVGRWSVPDSISILKDNTDLLEGPARDMKLIFQDNFAADTGKWYLPHTDGPGKTLCLGPDHEMSDSHGFNFTRGNAKWIKAQATFHCQDKEDNLWEMAQFTVRLKNKKKTVKENMIRVYHYLNNNETKDIKLEMKLPNEDYDSINIYFWNVESKKPLWIDSLKVWTFND